MADRDYEALREQQALLRDIRDEMRAYLAKNEFGAGLAHGVKRTGEVLAGFFPYQAGDVNELSNEISFGL